MNIYENNKKGKSYRSASACSYCRKQDHNVNECPKVAEDWKIWQGFVVPIQSTTLLTRPYWQRPQYWSEWYMKCEEAHYKQVTYQAKQAAGKPKRKKVIDRKCGFCGTSGHNRKNCSKMKGFLKDAYAANANWRRKAYELIVKKLGISIGAAIELTYEDRYGTGRKYTKVAIVTGVNFEELNVMCDLPDTWGNHDYRCKLHVHALVDGKTKRISFNSDELKGVFNERTGSWNYGEWQYSKCIANAPKPLDEAWVEDYKQAFDFIVKKRSYDKLKEHDVIDTIDKWK